MTNYYEELKLDKTLSLNELRENLILLESIWTDRASTRPEKAAEMLVLINQAKKVFSTDLSRAAYDRELFAPPKEETAADPNAARKAEFEKWKKTAQDYYDRQEYDMAKTALDKALQNADEDDFAFLQLAAQICKSNGEYQVALSHINKALLIAPDLAELYITKALILVALFIEESRRGFGDAAAHLQQARNTMRMASEKAATQGNKTAEAHADGYLAFLLYFYEPKDTALAERLARKAVENGDDWGNARRVLEDLEEKRTAAEKAAQAERERREKLAREEQARREKLAREEQARREAAERAEKERQQHISAMAEKEKKAKSLYLAGWIAIVLSYVLCFVEMRSAIAAFFIAFVTFCSAALFNYADSFKNGYSSPLVTGISTVLGFVWCFETATAAYITMENNAARESKTWTICEIMLVIYFGIVFGAKVMGKNADKKTRFKFGRFGMREAAAPTRSVEPAPQPRVQVPEKAGGTKHPEAFGPAGGSGAGDDKFMPLTANPQGRKIVVVSLGIALAMIVLLLLMGKTSIFSLIAPAILFILLLMNVDVDSAPMAIPATILAVLAFLNLVRFGAQGKLLFSFLVNAGVAVVYWLLALKKKNAPKMAAGLLLLLFGIRILMGVFSLFSAFRYSIFSVMSSLSVCIMYMSYFAAVLFACKHMVGKGLPEK